MEAVARAEALARLQQDFGIRGAQIYLLDVIPLVDMLWADGKCQQAEWVLISKYLREHVQWLRAQADGEDVISEADVDAFVRRFVEHRPPASLLNAVWELAYEHKLAPAATGSDAVQRQKVLDYCVDIGAAAVAAYPYGPHERFEDEEKSVLRKLVAALNG